MTTDSNAHSETPPDPMRAVLENVRLSAAAEVEPAMVLVTALMSRRSSSIDEALDQLIEHRRAIVAAAAEGVAETSRRPAQLEPALVFDPEVARVRRDLADHELRGRLLFDELLGRKTFFQVVAWTLCGVELSAQDAALVDHLGVSCQLGDPCIWPLAIARRISAETADLGRVVAGATANMISPKLGPKAIGAFMRFADAVEAEVAAGASLAEVLDGRIEAGAVIPGVNRPFLGQDERVPHMTRLVESHGRARGKTVRLALRIDAHFCVAKGIRLNAAGMLGAVYRDLGLPPAAAESLCLVHLLPLALCQHTFVQEHAADCRAAR